MTRVCPPGTVLNPLTNRCVKVDGKIGKKILATKPPSPPPPAKTKSKTPSPKTKTLSPSPKTKTPSAKSKTPSPNKMQELVKKQMEAMRARNIPLLQQLAKEIEEEKKKAKSAELQKMPDFLKVCINPVTKTLTKLPTVEGEKELTEVIKEEKQLIIIDGFCYDIYSLFEMIQADINQGNVWGTNPYVKNEGFVLPFDKTVKQTLLSEGIKRGVLPKNAKYIDHSPASAADLEMRGTCVVTKKNTPALWLKNGWASDGSAFPTKTYYSIEFKFPNKRRMQTPGRLAIFPDNDEAKAFIYDKLMPIYNAGALWAKKLSVTDGVENISPNIHLIFEDNQPYRWYKDKLENLDMDVLKYSPAYI